jgi:hypothetical protein
MEEQYSSQQSILHMADLPIYQNYKRHPSCPRRNITAASPLNGIQNKA